MIRPATENDFSKITLIEKDYKLVKSLYEKFNDRVNIKNEDILNFQINYMNYL